MTFKFPPIYQFPPFFTLQPVMETQRKQCDLWCELILGFMKHHKLTEIKLPDALNSPLFYNKSINCRLPPDAVEKFLEKMVSSSKAVWKDENHTVCKVLWRTAKQWADIIHKWATDNAMTGTVLTFYELREGDDTTNEPFHMMDQDLMKDAIKALQKAKKAQLIDSPTFDECGVKFL